MDEAAGPTHRGILTPGGELIERRIRTERMRFEALLVKWYTDFIDLPTPQKAPLYK
jgi:hypothetical protein